MPCNHDWLGPVFAAGNQLGLGAAALKYAGLGYAVLPAERGGKKPHRMLPWSGDGRSGVHLATGDQAVIRQWWRGDPAANIAVPTGSLAVVDLDIKGEHDGPGNFRAFLAHGGLAMPPTAISRTASGGLQHWLVMPPGYWLPERPAILPGVDIKGYGGYVVAPPSPRLIIPHDFDGEPVRMTQIPVPYEWISGCPCTLAWAPEWLLLWVASMLNSSVANNGGLEDPMDLDQLKKDGVPVGERNSTFYRIFCKLYRQRGTIPAAASHVLSEVTEIYQASDTHGFSRRELMVCAESARKFIARCEQQELIGRANYMAWVSRRGF